MTNEHENRFCMAYQCFHIQCKRYNNLTEDMYKTNKINELAYKNNCEIEMYTCIGRRHFSNYCASCMLYIVDFLFVFFI